MEKSFPNHLLVQPYNTKYIQDCIKPLLKSKVLDIYHPLMKKFKGLPL